MVLLPDLNSDNQAEFAVAAKGNDSDRGKVYIYSGDDGSELDTLAGENQGDQYGYCLAGLSDFDNDSTDDLGIGARNYPGDGDQMGKAYVVKNGTGAVIMSFESSTANNKLGAAVSGADINGDETPDFIVGIPGRSGGKGRVKVFSGADGSTTLLTVNGVTDNDALGTTVSGVDSDLTGDSTSEVAIGVPGYDSSTGRVYVVDINGTYIYTFEGQSSGDEFGSSLAVGDIDGDDVDDFVIGAPYAESDAGKVYVYNGSTGQQFSYSPLTGEADSDLFGAAVAICEDYNNDGNTEFAVGAIGRENGNGAVYIIDGSNGEEYLNLMGSDYGINDTAAFGVSLDSGEDVDGDGRADLIIGASDYNSENGTDSGAAVVVSLQ